MKVLDDHEVADLSARLCRTLAAIDAAESAFSVTQKQHKTKIALLTDDAKKLRYSISTRTVEQEQLELEVVSTPEALAAEKPPLDFPTLEEPEAEAAEIVPETQDEIDAFAAGERDQLSGVKDAADEHDYQPGNPLRKFYLAGRFSGANLKDEEKDEITDIDEEDGDDE